MKIDSILVVCIGNICRSPLAERALAARLPGVRVGSAGLAALVGSAADEGAAAAAAEHGLSLDGHVARQWSGALARSQDLILVMEPDQKAQIVRAHPELSGKTFLMTQWTGGAGIGDPYKRSSDMHRAVAKQILDAADQWAARLKGRR